MKFYNKYYDSCYDELLTFYPEFYTQIFEMTEILKAQGRALDDFEAAIEQTYFNCFIDYADERTIENLERFLGIGLNKSRAFSERRRLIKSFFVGSGKVSASMLKEMIQSYTGADVAMRFEPFDSDKNNMLYLDIDRGKETTLYMSDIILLLNHKIPAHIKWQAAITYPFPVGVGVRRAHYKFGYESCGTKPDISMIGAFSVIASAVKTQPSISVPEYRQTANENELTGTGPDIAYIGAVVSVNGVVKAQADNVTADYKAPQEASQEAGRMPYDSALGNQSKVNAALSVKNTDCSVNYIYCGTQYTQS